MTEPESPDVTTVRKRSVRVVDQGGVPVEQMMVARLASNGTYLQGVTDSAGVWQFSDHFAGTVTILVGGKGWTAESETLEAANWSAERMIKVSPLTDGGSIIFPQSTGYIPGLSGRLNPIRDSINRYYLYADNISINDAPEQPARFEVGRDFIVEDAVGNRFMLNIKEILGRTSLIQYRKLRQSPISASQPLD